MGDEMSAAEGDPRARSAMRVQATRETVEFVIDHGGRLYVWADLMQCRGCSLPFLTASTECPDEIRDFGRLSSGDFDLFYSDGALDRPGQLIVELSGWRKKRLSVRTPDFWIKE